MTGAPLEASDPQLAAIVKRKVLERLADVARHYRALDVAMASFGEGFVRDRFTRAAASEDPTELNRVKAVERGLDQLFNYLAELGALGLELAELRAPDDEPGARGDLRKLREIGVIDEQLRDQLTRVAGIRNRMVHDYVGVAALDVHQAARLLHAALPRFVTAYQQWLRAGFPATGSGPAPSANGTFPGVAGPPTRGVPSVRASQDAVTNLCSHGWRLPCVENR